MDIIFALKVEHIAVVLDVQTVNILFRGNLIQDLGCVLAEALWKRKLKDEAVDVGPLAELLNLCQNLILSPRLS